MRTECEICRFVFATPQPHGDFVRCPTCHIEVDPQREPSEEEEDDGGQSPWFWVYLIGCGGALLLCSIGAVVYSAQLRGQVP